MTIFSEHCLYDVIESFQNFIHQDKENILLIFLFGIIKETQEPVR
jgi:hypothetical protein